MSLSTSALAADASVLTVFNKPLSDEHFVPMTREEYLNSKAACKNISYEEVEKEPDAKIATSDTISMDLNLKLFSYSTSVGGTAYHRNNISDSILNVHKT